MIPVPTSRIRYLLLMLFLPVCVLGQELECEVTVDDTNLEGTSFAYVKANLETQLESYINEYRWTDIDFTERERIQCQINILLLAGTQNFEFDAEAVVSARRPIYNTNAETTSIIINDQAWQFSYQENRALTHDELQFEALTGFIDYYCYILLGYDFDSFSNLGGTPYYTKAQNVLDLAQNTSAIGWTRSSNNRRNRFVLVTELLNNSFQPLRTAYYTYHRMGLDQFTQNAPQARRQVINALTQIQDNKRKSTSTYLFDIFFDTKSKELASIFLDGESTVQLEAYNILRETDPGHLTEYEQLQN